MLRYHRYMTEILLARHAQSWANKRDFTAFGNMESPLTEKGIQQALTLGQLLRYEYGIDPELYGAPVLASEYVRPKQTAEVAGFRNIHIDGLINECEMKEEITSGIEVIKKHREERWVPEKTKENAKRFIDLVGQGDLGYEVYFTHGMFIAGVLLELDEQGIRHAYTPDDQRGYVPLQASVTALGI